MYKLSQVFDPLSKEPPASGNLTDPRKVDG